MINFNGQMGKATSLMNMTVLEPMDYLVDEETCALETVSSHTPYLCNMPRESDREQSDEPKDVDVHMREATVKRVHTLLRPGQARFFKLMFEKY
ncbi:hypothetical protein VTP01DRAFT_5022 [Rhizomucor pusillus]|uniref:uncharacterized protein n=1 Tax=Rhizomucor pusillus TaxID=4840 RepID=UPI003742F81F